MGQTFFSDHSMLAAFYCQTGHTFPLKYCYKVGSWPSFLFLHNDGMATCCSIPHWKSCCPTGVADKVGNGRTLRQDWEPGLQPVLVSGAENKSLGENPDFSNCLLSCLHNMRFAACHGEANHFSVVTRQVSYQLFEFISWYYWYVLREQSPATFLTSEDFTCISYIWKHVLITSTPFYTEAKLAPEPVSIKSGGRAHKFQPSVLAYYQKPSGKK